MCLADQRRQHDACEDHYRGIEEGELGELHFPDKVMLTECDN